MGTSTDAILTYGFDVGEELPQVIQQWMDDNDERFLEFDDFICHVEGLPEATYDADSEYWDKRCEVIKNCPVEVVQHCSGEYPMYIVGVRGATVEAYRGCAKEIGEEAMNVSGFVEIRAQEWCKKVGIKWQEPKWLLCSYWG